MNKSSSEPEPQKVYHVKVKPLVWVDFDETYKNSHRKSCAVSPITGHEYIIWIDGSVTGYNFVRYDVGVEEGKQMAEEHHQSVILSGLELMEFDQKEPVRKFVEGLFDDYNLHYFMSQRICCNGYECGCMGADVWSYLNWITR